MSVAPVIEFDSATVGYGSSPVVNCRSLRVSPGELVGLVGPNGAGKSTLLRVVTGDARLLGGRVDLDGQSLERLDPRARARIVGVVPQQIVAAFSVPAVDFVSMGRHPHLARFAPVGEVDREVVMESMRLTDTAHLADKPVDALSGGDLQRLALAQALAQKPRLLLLDEPTSHLDLNHRLQVLDLVRDLVATGMGVLAVFHDLDLAARYSDRVAVVAEGAVSEAAAPEEVITAEMLRSTFGVRAVVGIEPVTGAISVTPVLREGAVVSRGGGRVLVIGGSGAAAPLIRKLVLAGWEVMGGALNAGDADAVLCEALDLAYVALPAFAPMDDAARTEVSRLAGTADAVVVCDVPFGNGNVGNLEAIVNAGTPVILIKDVAGRDYTGGRATEVWARLIENGASLVSDAEEASRKLETLSAQTE